MRILIVDNYYPAFLKSFSLSKAARGHRFYEELHTALMNQFFGLSDAYSFNLRKLGCDAKEIVWNFQPLQELWAEENLSWSKLKHQRLSFSSRRKWGLTVPWIEIDRKKRLEYILLEQIISYKPDVLYIQDIGKLSSALIEASKGYTRLVVAQHATTFPSDRDITSYDLIISSLPKQISLFRERGKRSEYLPLGFDQRVLGRMTQTSELRYLYDITHVGGYGLIHRERNQFLEQVARSTGVSFWGYGLKTLSRTSPIRRFYRGEAWGLSMYKIRASSKITITKHVTEVAGPFANVCSLYEASGVGSCVLTDEKINVRDLFQPGTEIVTYKSANDCSEKADYLIQHDSERNAIANAGQKRTLRDHTYYARMSSLKEILEKYL